jgi:hypothetical protein
LKPAVKRMRTAPGRQARLGEVNPGSSQITAPAEVGSQSHSASESTISSPVSSR